MAIEAEMSTKGVCTRRNDLIPTSHTITDTSTAIARFVPIVLSQGCLPALMRPKGRR